MTKPWDLKTEDKRVADSLPNFIIICEDEVSEPIYLHYFHTSKIKVNYVKNQKSMMTNVINAIHHCEENGLTTHIDGEHCMEEGTQVWCVFDRDKEETAEKVRKGDITFNESLETAKRRGIKVAWSNDAFELWVLLHFEDVNLDSKHRINYYDRLTEIFRALPNPNEDLKKVLVHNSYSYKRNLKSENNFRDIVRSVIVGKTKEAIERAKVLENNYQNKNLQEHEKSPCTLVYHLVEELIRLGGKEI
jgi:hypothetical protein